MEHNELDSRRDVHENGRKAWNKFWSRCLPIPLIEGHHRSRAKANSKAEKLCSCSVDWVRLVLVCLWTLDYMPQIWAETGSGTTQLCRKQQRP